MSQGPENRSSNHETTVDSLRKLNIPRYMIIPAVVARTVKTKLVDLGRKEYIREQLNEMEKHGNGKLQRLWSDMLNRGNENELSTQKAEIFGAVLIYDALQRVHTIRKNRPLVISDTVISTIGEDRNIKGAFFGGFRLDSHHRTEQAESRIVLDALARSCPDFFQVINKTSKSILTIGDVLSYDTFLMGMKDSWLMFLRQQQPLWTRWSGPARLLTERQLYSLRSTQNTFAGLRI